MRKITPIISCDTVYDVVHMFIKERIPFYYQRKRCILAQMDAEIAHISDKIKFVLAVIEGRLVVNRRSKDAVVADMRNLDLNEELLKSTKVYSFTKEALEKYYRQKTEMIQRREELDATSGETLWFRELNELHHKLVANGY